VIGLTSAAAVLINPFGLDTLLLPFRTIGIGVLRDFIQEWSAPDFHMSQVVPFAVMLIGTFTIAGLSSRRLDIRDAIMLAGTATMSLLAARNISTFALVAAPIFSVHLSTYLADLGLALNSSRIRARGVFLAVNWLLLIFVIFGVIVWTVSQTLPAALAKTRRATLPAAAVQHLKSENLPREVFNSYNWGGYVIWEARDYPVFIDGRTDLYDDAFVRDYLRTYLAEPGWQDRLDEGNINTVLVETSSPLAKVLALSPGWEKDYSDDLAVIYIRSTVTGDQP
jgi:hypothetical protein